MFDDPLHPNVLKIAYSNGFFPMPHPETGQIMWFNPDPRAIMPLGGFHLSASMRRFLAKTTFTVTFDQAFESVIESCADRKDTWITEQFRAAYTRLHRLNLAHSAEVWDGNQLVGGVYGVSIGGAFFAESMFHRATNASKMALFHLVRRLNELGYRLLEVQFMTPHLKSLGAIEIPSDQYLNQLRAAIQVEPASDFVNSAPSPAETKPVAKA
jgi:leucyl/phenylalanyl-tRNA--protein transferase